ncbi:leucine-rich repeat domain-containing protein [Bifidobacterium thermophilum]|uniref:leucine-rich repeat domain-containing protein n=1 Tax=Bifidobacterium thermophilum TaxID=33905 RepID=UPI0030A51A51
MRAGHSAGLVFHMVPVVIAVCMSLAMAPAASAADVDGSSCSVGVSSIAQCFPDRNLADAVAEANSKRPSDVFTQQIIDNTTTLRHAAEDSTHTNVDASKSITSLKGIQRLQRVREISLWGEGIHDLSPLYSLPQLSILWIGKSDKIDVTQISRLTQLTELHLYADHISDVSSLNRLGKVNSLDLSDNGIANVAALSKLTNLVSLNLGANQISDISPLQNLTKLNDLDLGENDITDVTPLYGLTGLTSLDLSGNDITDIQPLRQLSKLQILSLGSNRIRDVKALSGLSNLMRLSLSDNDVSDITPISRLTKLVVLGLSANRIADFSPASKLPHVIDHYLYSSHQRIGAASMSVKLGGLVSLQAAKGRDGRYMPIAGSSPSGATLDQNTGKVTWRNVSASGIYSYTFGDKNTDPDYTGGVSVWVSVPGTSVTLRDVAVSDVSSHGPDVQWLANAGISSGYPDGTFRGMLPVYRQDMAAFLRREAGRHGDDIASSADADTKFNDVTEDTPHVIDISWLARTGITTGYSDGTFRGMLPVYRQDMAAFLRREAVLMGVPDASSWKPSDADWRRFRDVSRDTPAAFLHRLDGLK